MESIPINEVIEAAETYAAERISLSRIRLVETLDPLLRPVKADRSLLKYVFFSMIANAVNHLHGHGVVTIVTENSAEGVVQVKVSASGSGAKGDRDVGPLDPHTDSVATRRGTGLPLSVVRDIIVGQGGKMSWEAGGAGEVRFTVSFPGINET
jgi:two-component system cell cycle sensor histidine kinase/response regulator CckA